MTLSWYGIKLRSSSSSSNKCSFHTQCDHHSSSTNWSGECTIIIITKQKQNDKTNFFFYAKRIEKRSFNAEKRIRTVLFHSGGERLYQQQQQRCQQQHQQPLFSSCCAQQCVVAAYPPLFPSLSLSLTTQRISHTH